MTDPYASHLPVLRLLGRTLPIKRVLEFGAGWHSTPMFLNRSNYPVLERLVSVETDAEWRTALDEKYGSDKRWICTDVWDGSADYDLIFIDSGPTDTERVEVIQAVVALRPAATVVIHDYEHLPYQQAADFDRCVICDAIFPWTAVCWNGERPELEAMNNGVHLTQAH